MQRYDARTALVVVDLQNDFADAAGALAVHGGANLVPIINAEVTMARATGATIVFSQDWHPTETPHFATSGGTWPVHCVAGTWGAELHPDVDPAAAAAATRGRTGLNGEDGYSAFSVRDPATAATTPTELESLLRGAGIERVVVCGLATDHCVKATAIDAARLGFETAVLLDAIRPVELVAGDEQRALAAMTRAGVHTWSTRMR
ncbi:MAG: bifunctional nicotinamidase/pyrazinamidase [Candidatus Limnocylindrales bacterium]